MFSKIALIFLLTKPMKVQTLHPQTKPYNSRCARAWNFFLLVICLLFCQVLFSQPPTPTFKPFQPISSNTSQNLHSNTTFGKNANPLMPNDPYAQQNARVMQQAAINNAQTIANRQKQLTPDAYTEEDRREEMNYFRRAKEKTYQQSLEQLVNMNVDSFSLAKAIYLTESAWYNDAPPYEDFAGGIKFYAEIVKQLLQREGLSIKNNSAINYGVQKLFKQDNTWFDKKAGKTYRIAKLHYDFKDYLGEQQWSNMFVDKLMRTSGGQCHSMPLLYLCIIEQLGGKAYLSLSPSHSLIQYFGTNGKRYNFETTNGNHVNESWLLQSTFVSAAALANKTYLDTLSSRQLFAQVLADLLLNYMDQLGFDATAESILQKIREVDPNSMHGLLVEANLISFEFDRKLKELGNPPPSELNQHPDLEQAYHKMHAAYRRIDETGYQEMPPDAYQQWLKSMQQTEQEQQDKVEYEKLLRELNKLKNVKPSFKNDPKQ